MDQLIPTITAEPPKTNWLLFLLVGIVILSMGIGIGLFLAKNIYPPLQSLPASTPSPTPIADPTANWKTYTIEKFGIQFKLPSKLSTLGDLDIKECAGEKGMEFSATLPSNKSSGYLISVVYAGGGCAAHNLFSMGAVSSDYEAGRSRRFTDTNGYVSKTGTYYCVGPGAVRNDEVPSHLAKEMVSKNGVTVLRIMGEDESYGTWPKLCTPGSGKIGALVNLSNNKTFPGIAIQMDVTDQLSENLFDQILSTFKFTGVSVTPTPTPTPTITPTSNPKTTYIVPTSWKRLTTQSGLNLCLPPKWEVEAYDHLIFNRDEGYKPSITYITNLPYSGGSRREAYFAYWVQEYPDVKQLVSVADTDINGNSALTIYPANSSDPKTSPEGLTVVWFSAGKLWKAGLSGWNMTNASQTSFLKDFYTMISCSF